MTGQSLIADAEGLLRIAAVQRGRCFALARQGCGAFLILNKRNGYLKKALILTNQSGFLWKFELENILILQSLGLTVHYASNSAEEGYHYDPCDLERMGVIYHDIPIARSPYMWRMNFEAFCSLMDIIEKEEIDLIHCHTPVGGVLGRLAGHFSKRRPCVIYTAHGFHFYKGAPFFNNVLYRAAEHLLAPMTDVLIVINREDYAAAKKMRLKKGGRLCFVPGVGLDMKKFRPADATERANMRRRIGLGQNDFFILSAGELNRNKNHVTAMRAVLKLKRSADLKGRRLIYGICGDGYFMNEARQYAAGLGLSEDVRFFGYQRQMRDYYGAADATVFPSVREGLGMAGLESLAMGVPVIAADNRGSREYMVDGLNGYVCAPRDVDGFASGILKIMGLTEEEREKMAKRCVKSAWKFSKERTKSRMFEIYKLMRDVHRR